jgi:hypothetical protein
MLTIGITQPRAEANRVIPGWFRCPLHRRPPFSQRGPDPVTTSASREAMVMQGKQRLTQYGVPGNRKSVVIGTSGVIAAIPC